MFSSKFLEGIGNTSLCEIKLCVLTINAKLYQKKNLNDDNTTF